MAVLSKLIERRRPARLPRASVRFCVPIAKEDIAVYDGVMVIHYHTIEWLYAQMQLQKQNDPMFSSDLENGAKH